ncbi:MAG: 4-alpha-glucanotransferase [Deltaproteobacteria bacterium]|nr:4-alpha-glucanotransferase [Deltaproteobacteria bacterium]
MSSGIQAQQIATLGQLCGITRSFQDNQGKRHRTSRATYEALLTAMGTPWENPDVLRMEIERRQRSHFDRLLQPVTAVPEAPAPSGLAIPVRTAKPEVPKDLQGGVELTTESGETWVWEGTPEAPVQPSVIPMFGGWRVSVRIPLPESLESGYHKLNLRMQSRHGEETGSTLLVVHPAAAYQPPCLAGNRRLWGFNLPLYALTGEHNWGIGDFSDLREMIALAGEAGAAFVGVNPLHAALPQPQAHPSPYSPNSRMFLNFLYLDLQEVPELSASPAAQHLLANPEFQAAKARVQASPLVDYEEVFRLKRQILGPLYEAFQAQHDGEQPKTARGREFSKFVAEKNEILQKYAEYTALAEYWGHPDWRRWPPEYHHPGNAAVSDFAKEHRKEVLLHKYVQWLAAAQLNQTKEKAYEVGLPFTLYQDLALGAVAGGFETWAYPGLFAQGVALGAPPDAFNPKGQDWGLPPMVPETLRDLEFQPFIQTLRANLPENGMLRLDHVMALFRLFWIPHREEKVAGAYVEYPARELLAILALESQRRRTLIIGEDLGTVAPHIRRELRKRGIFSYRVFYFERDRQGRFKNPQAYPRQAMAAVTTHDLPTLAGFWEEEDIKIKQKLDLYPQKGMAAAEKKSRKKDRAGLMDALKRQKVLSENLFAKAPADKSLPAEIRFGVLEYLGQSAAALAEIRLEDVFGVSEQQNMPGTIAEYPNWRKKLPLSLAQMRQAPELQELAKRMARSSRRAGNKEKQGID